MSEFKFYGVNIDSPLSLAHNTTQWSNSTIRELYTKTNEQVYIREVPIASQNATYCWRVVDAVYSQEDSLITYFQAYDIEGAFLPRAVFGVNYSTVPQRIGGGFIYQPEFDENYYIPVQNNFQTQNTGGYTAQVLDLNYPSEGMAFGMYKQGAQHQNLVISFRLFPMTTDYPNDM